MVHRRKMVFTKYDLMALSAPKWLMRKVGRKKVKKLSVGELRLAIKKHYEGK